MALPKFENAVIKSPLKSKQKKVEGLTASDNVATLANALNKFYVEQQKNTTATKPPFWRDKHEN